MASIFVVDNEATYLQLIQDILNDAGYSQVVGHVGGGAFPRIRAERPDLVLLGINLVDPARGWATLDAVRRHPETRHIPVILCSTDMRLLNAKADRLRGMNCQTLEKPFDIESLLTKVAGAIGPPPA